MKRTNLNYLINVLSLLAMLGLAVTGITIRYLLPPGSGGRGGGTRLTAWGLGRHDWGDIHFWLAVGVVVLLVFHVALHWGWVVLTTQRFLGLQGGAASARPVRARLLGLAFGVCVVLLVVGLAWLVGAGVERTQSGRLSDHVASGTERAPAVHAVESGHGKTAWLRGSTTLAEAAAQLGEEPDLLIARLSLPAGVSPNERLGRIARQRGVPMSWLRQLILTGQADATQRHGRSDREGSEGSGRGR